MASIFALLLSLSHSCEPRVKQTNQPERWCGLSKNITLLGFVKQIGIASCFNTSEAALFICLSVCLPVEPPIHLCHAVRGSRLFGLPSTLAGDVKYLRHSLCKGLRGP
ncbi:hypothetical protein B0T26DRAFT_704487 [Lasiosphaeria miniovina]|uniref:Secreted protein n=1 Tax=Lasiosphaeria miniovina TaxID=1954250 RepID=A0AA40AVP6_9PEZI|nr:uncharacterized protein B0T26DRAFT_704487 [Lasiosphaeria miniovina]KAK0722893.1 hypothetical protein B0T26DRAFT_704487 [Lasiosphaeria miniovina]